MVTIIQEFVGLVGVMACIPAPLQLSVARSINKVMNFFDAVQLKLSRIDMDIEIKYYVAIFYNNRPGSSISIATGTRARKEPLQGQ